TQQGNNNAYCQDNPITWIDWSLAEEARAEFLRFCQALGQLRSRLPLLQARQAWTPETATWQRPDGLAMQAEDWHAHPPRGLALTRLDPQDGSALWWAMNPTPHSLNFVLPEGSWMLALDTAHPSRPSEMLQHRETVSAGCIIIGYTYIHKHI
ncbi:MAG: hypothetical protein RJA77_1061, partial [Pseudomonadota bacterium]